VYQTDKNVWEAANTDFIVFGLTRAGLENRIYRTRGKHTNYYNINAVSRLRNPYKGLLEHKQNSWLIIDNTASLKISPFQS
jgi:hypothetical protein